MYATIASAIARLAQLVEHYIDIVEVTGSCPVSRTNVQLKYPPTGLWGGYFSCSKQTALLACVCARRSDGIHFYQNEYPRAGVAST